MKTKLENMYSFEKGEQVSDEQIEKWHKNILSYLKGSKGKFDVNRISSGNGFVIGIKSDNLIEVYEVKSGYVEYEYEYEEG